MAEDRIKTREEHSREIREAFGTGAPTLESGAIPPPESFVGREEGAEAPELPTEHLVINVGPSHPVTHGTVRFLMKLDGETIVDIDPDIGYLHRGFEKQSENARWSQVFPYVDRLNYVSPMLNNVGYAMAVEKLAGITDPPRSKYIRVIGGEIHRICDHLTAAAAMALELGAFSVFLYAIEARELLYDRISELTGARLMVTFCRIGGVARDIPEGWSEKVLHSLDRTLAIIVEIEALLGRNRIFIDRMRGTGVISKEDAIAYGVTGPTLRSAGVDYDIRKDHPYLVYDEFDWDVPVGEFGDNYDRYLVRMEEMRQSIRIIQQALAKLPGGPIIVDDWKYALPPKAEVYHTIEATIAHFELVMYGVQVPKGEAYCYTEAGNGELGFYVVSNGGGSPYKVKVRSPSLANTSALPLMVRGALLADLVPTFDTINMIGGEIDR